MRVKGEDKNYEKEYKYDQVPADRLAIIEDMIQGASSTHKLYYAVIKNGAFIHKDWLGPCGGKVGSKGTRPSRSFIRGTLFFRHQPII